MNNSSLENEINPLTNEVDRLNTEIEELKEVIATKEKHISKLENFTYLDEFTEQERDNYDLFLNDSDMSYLKDLSPEKIVLLYFHSLATSDLETIYAITFDGGTLPNFTDFSDQFYSSDYSLRSNESILRFRNYDTIHIREENQTENIVGVEISVHYGTLQSTEIFDVQKEEDQWKIVLQHLL